MSCGGREETKKGGGWHFVGDGSVVWVRSLGSYHQAGQINEFFKQVGYSKIVDFGILSTKGFDFAAAAAAAATA